MNPNYIDVVSWHTGRTYTLYNHHEATFFYLVEWTDIVKDIKLHVPLKREELTRVYLEMGWFGPKSQKTQFLITTNEGKKLAHAIIPDYLIDDPDTLVALASQQKYWENRGATWKTFIASQFNYTLANNVRTLHGHRQPSPEFPNLDLLEKVSQKTWKNQAKSLASIAAYCDQRMEQNPGTALKVIYHFLATKRWAIDMSTPIDIHKTTRFQNATETTHATLIYAP